jgi:hypothetical protein
VVQTVSKRLSIKASWERLDSNVPEERACFAAIGISDGNQWLTEHEDIFVGIIRHEAHLSAYQLAEWLAWNWWRLRWEPRRAAIEWALAHRMSTIGGGYVWPNITVVSDGERVLLHAQPTRSTPSEPLRYVANIAAVVSAREFDAAVDDFVNQVVGKLIADRVENTNLATIWNDLLIEREDSDAALFRKFEALLGHDPDEADPEVIQRLIEDSKSLGEQAMAEIAANKLFTAAELRTLAQRAGVQANIKNAVHLDAQVRARLPIGVPAWKRGAEAAKALREQVTLGAAPISDTRLCEMAGVSLSVITGDIESSPISFVLDQDVSGRRVALRSRRPVGRRFNLARLIGDLVTQDSNGRLFPATNAHTYRQKLQRAFAAEFLCPFEPMADMLHGDFSPESIEEVANYFNVSEMTVQTLLVNHGLLDAEVLEGEVEFNVAA